MNDRKEVSHNKINLLSLISIWSQRKVLVKKEEKKLRRPTFENNIQSNIN